ncbi:MAG: N-6 DNA methylase [Candidatus Pacebacteria bacterium]|nr:N-6 DNA methylase [Candidatus Paceibacterota bacterium]
MLNDTTKRKINSLRQILVGKVPDPKSQVEQITNALIYKYMDDMDRQAEVFGGQPSFFVKEYEKYAWRNLMNPKLGGQERMNLYMEALEKMGTNKNLSPIFRDILKNSYVPYRSPETLNLFLAEIDGFSYDHSEDLGDAFEFLLSILGSQGDAGQFRTPRHIIDFIVEAVDPKKDQKILDPACGTAGFLISAYKHILKSNQKENPGDTLTHDERQNLHKNFVGYDISPEMAKLSRVNMFLHNFPDPKIYEYDTLSSDARWADTFDVIIANPPFMSPKGGIIPHKKFRIPANRAEVLFVDYIVEHLKPKGRAGIIVPEGIIFQSSGAYKDLRKMLVDEGLFAVVSLPSGVFNPYAGVKTSVLLFDNALSKQSTEILFVKIESDGFDLGAQRRPIDKNDLPDALHILNEWKAGKKLESAIAVWVEKSMIAEGGDFNLSGSRYAVSSRGAEVTGAWPIVNLGDVAEIMKGSAITKKDAVQGSIPVIAGGQQPAYYHNESNRTGEVITVSASGAYAGFVNYFEIPIFASDCSTIQTKDDGIVDTKYLFSILKAKQEDIYAFQQGGAQPHVYPKDLKSIKIPLPPLDIQKQIVAELDGYQNIIDAAKQIVTSWKPRIDIDPTWERVKLGEVCEINSTLVKPIGPVYESMLHVGGANIEAETGNIIAPKSAKEEGLISGKFLFDENMVLYSKIRPYLMKVARPDFKGLCSADIYPLSPKSDKILRDYLFCQLLTSDFTNYAIQGSDRVGMPKVNREHLFEYSFFLPPIATQKQIVETIEAERVLVEGNKKLIEIYEQKTKDSIAKLWGE